MLQYRAVYSETLELYVLAKRGAKKDYYDIKVIEYV